MTLQADKDRVRALLTETMVLLCKNSLQFKASFSVEALIGITIDESEVILLRVNESIRAHGGANASSVATRQEYKADPKSRLMNFKPGRGSASKVHPRGGGKTVPSRSSTSENIISFSPTKLNPLSSQSLSKPRGSHSFAGKRGFHNSSKMSRPSSSNLDSSQNTEEGNDLPISGDVDLVDASDNRSEAGSDTSDTTTNVKGEVMDDDTGTNIKGEIMDEDEEQMNLDPDIGDNTSATEDDLVLSCSTSNDGQTMRPTTTKSSTSGLEEVSTPVIMSTGYPRMYVCSECGKRSTNKRELQGHMASRHNQAKEYLCTECGKEFAYKRGLSQHYRNVHNMGITASWIGPNTGM